MLQVRIEGQVEKLSAAESDAYFHRYIVKPKFMKCMHTLPLAASGCDWHSCSLPESHWLLAHNFQNNSLGLLLGTEAPVMMTDCEDFPCFLFFFLNQHVYIHCMRCSRPRGSQIGAVVSHQSSVLPHGRQELEQREQDLQQVLTLPPRQQVEQFCSQAAHIQCTRANTGLA